MVKANRQTLLLGEDSNNVKLTENDVIKIRELSKLGYSRNRLGRLFDTSKVNIGLIVNRKTWKYI